MQVSFESVVVFAVGLRSVHNLVGCRGFSQPRMRQHLITEASQKQKYQFPTSPIVLSCDQEELGSSV